MRNRSLWSKQEEKESKETQQRYSSKSSMSLESWWQAEDIQPTLLLVNEVARWIHEVCQQDAASINKWHYL